MSKDEIRDRTKLGCYLCEDGNSVEVWVDLPELFLGGTGSDLLRLEWDMEPTEMDLILYYTEHEPLIDKALRRLARQIELGNAGFAESLLE